LVKTAILQRLQAVLKQLRAPFIFIPFLALFCKDFLCNINKARYMVLLLSPPLLVGVLQNLRAVFVQVEHTA